MVTPEGHPKITPEIIAKHRVLNALDRLSNIEIPPDTQTVLDIPSVADSARWCSTMIKAEFFDLEVVDTSIIGISNCVVDFKVERSPITDEIEGKFIIDLHRLDNSQDSTVLSELARETSVAATFPDKGYCDRLIEVYGTAIEVQKRWLEATKAPATIHDPRFFPITALTRNVLGKFGYSSDFGFEDWKKALDWLIDFEETRNITRDQSRIRALNNIMGDRNAFLVARSDFMNNPYEERRFTPPSHEVSADNSLDDNAFSNAEFAASIMVETIR